MPFGAKESLGHARGLRRDSTHVIIVPRFKDGNAKGGVICIERAAGEYRNAIVSKPPQILKMFGGDASFVGGGLAESISGRTG